MLGFFKKFINYNDREIARYAKVVEDINKLEDKAKKLKDADFAKETRKLKEKVGGDSSRLRDVLPWSFALVRESSRRTLGLRHFDAQLIAGIGLFEGKIAEQKTGEGKTLSATTALYLHALVGKGAHLVTVNDYLARRDAGWMGGIFNLLGLSISVIISDESYIYDETHKDSQAKDWRLEHLRSITRKEAYMADITYGINSEFGFDYLRDNMAPSSADLSQRNYYFAIIDEADSILIDEARTPHIISSPYDKDTSRYYQYAKLVKSLDPKKDYVIDEKTKTANLTEEGVSKIESMLGIGNIYEKDFDTLFHIEAALKAETLFKIDKDYIVKEGEVVIVDEFTGRLLQGRRFSEGIHQAIEAKENVPIQRESKTLATVSLQNYFRMYERLAGMTGTAATESEEFHKIYKADVIVIPTHRPMIRKDHADMIYKTEKAKFDAVVEEIAKSHEIGRPVLVGTTSIEKNELLSRLLKRKGVPHELLNAKNHEREASIIEKAGEKGAVTVATNMAGRGVDIVLGGAEVVKLGGLYVIGTERHESRRIDNQLRGRSGRQGDPGDSRFFVSLEDDLMRIFGGEQISKLMTFFNLPEDQALTHPMVSKAIEQAQVKVEGYNFDIRKNLVEYDDVLNKQREIIYDLRKKILLLLGKDSGEFKETIFGVFEEEANILINQYLSEGFKDVPDATSQFIKELDLIIPLSQKKLTEVINLKDNKKTEEFIITQIEKEYEKREKEFGKNLWNNVVQSIFLTTIDQYWTEHLTAIEDLRQGIGLRGYGQLDPLVEYKNDAFSMFEKLILDVNSETTQRVFKVRIESAPSTTHQQDHSVIYKSASSIDPFTKKEEVSPTPTHLTTSDVVPQDSVPVQDETPSEVAGFKVIPPGVKKNKLGRNDPCWCGSGKKYKKCHYPD